MKKHNKFVEYCWYNWLHTETPIENVFYTKKNKQENLPSVKSVYRIWRIKLNKRLVKWMNGILPKRAALWEFRLMPSMLALKSGIGQGTASIGLLVMGLAFWSNWPFLTWRARRIKGMYRLYRTQYDFYIYIYNYVMHQYDFMSYFKDYELLHIMFTFDLY